MSASSASAEKTERLLNLILALKSTRRPIPKDQLRRSLPAYAEAPSVEAFDRMFERDKDDLRALGIPLETGPVDKFFEDEQGYRIKRDAMHDALLTAFREWPTVKWTKPLGGLYCWLRFPPDVPTGPGSALIEEAQREGVMYVPGEFCHVVDSAGRLPTNEIRLCYGVATVDQIKEGIRRLAKAAKRLSALQAPVEEHAEAVA